MKKTINKIMAGSLMAVVCTAAVSCSDELNSLPSQSKVDGNLVVDQKSAVAALNGIYYTYAMCKTDNYGVKSTGCASYYEISPADLAGVAEYYQGSYILETHDASSMEIYGNYFWNAFYATVNAANAVIEQVGNASDSYFQGNKKNEILGEAYCMRALTYYNILRYFGYSWDTSSPYGAVLRMEKSTASNLLVKRSSVKDTYDQILADLDFAIANAPAENDNHKASQWFAKGLKARVLMMRGQSGDFDAAAALCTDIIANGPYHLEENYEDIFHAKGLESNEVIFGIMPKENQCDVYEAYYYRGSAQYLPTENMMALYEGDPRKDRMFSGKETEMIGYNPDGTYYFYTEIKYVICKHLVPEKMTFDDIEETQYQMRLSEIYLLKAEALARTGKTAEAGQLLKTIMSKSGIENFEAVDAATTTEAMLGQIFREDIRNLSFECGLEHDVMLRFPESITLQFNSVYKEQQYNVFGIPKDEFKYNSALSASDQNPGYSAN
ncbi:MAG: RagB/SusD family nutrient uptake outer membrane protein [Prevotella sp.]